MSNVFEEGLTNMKNVTNEFKERFSQVSNTLMVHIIGGTLIICILAAMIYYVYYKYTLLPKNCSQLNATIPALLNSSWVTTDSASPSSQYLLRDYYIKTAYNCCSTGDFTNDYVSTCALQNAIRMGCRCLDFEVYGYSGQPIIATSLSDDPCIKETYNYVDLFDAMNVVGNNAFNSQNKICPNPNDPLLLLFRIKTTDVTILNGIAEAINQSSLSSRLLPNYNHEFDGKNICAEPVQNFSGKVIIIIQSTPLLYQPGAEKLYEITNLTSNAFLRILTNFDVLNSPDITELTNFNKQYMSIILPNSSISPTNYNPIPPSLAGCQCMAMSFQQMNDGNLDIYNKWFEGSSSKSAFILKPADLMFVPQTIPVPTPQNPQLSFASRPLTSDMYNFKI